MKNLLLFSLLLLSLCSDKLIAQAPTCSPSVPFYVVDLRGNPTGTWISPGHARNSNCCGTTSPDRCTSFEIYVDTGAAMISFEIASGAIPPGSMFYQINCGPQIPVGQPICISGAGPHFLTFCKPGNNQNTYKVTSIAKPTFPPADTVRIGCSHPIPILGMVESSVTWNSIFPGAPGDYNSYLSCTSNCDTSIYTPAITAPPYVDYLVCGTPIATSCGYIAVCDTVRIYNEQPLVASASPNPAGFCQGGPGVTITTTASGGLAPYTYTWRDQSLNQTCTGASCLTTAAGIYSVEVRDQLYDSTYCPATFVSATVIVTPPPVVNAGADQTLCPTNPQVVLNGSIQFATGGTWTGGSGTFTPNNTSLLAGYTPTAGEIAAGQVTLTLTSTGAGGGCTDGSDDITIFFPPVLSVTVADVNVGCNGGTGTLSSVVTGGTGSYAYSWSTGQVTPSVTAGQGTYCVTVIDSLGCTASDCGSIIVPSQLAITVTSTACTVNGGNDGTATATVTGGTAPYSYLWSNGGTTATITGLSYGVYTVTVTDNNGCIIYSSVVVNEPRCNNFTVISSGTDVTCSGNNNGTATATVTNGTPNYSYFWTPSGQTTAAATNLAAGVHQCVVTDANGCFAAVNVTITQPTALSNTMTHTNATTIGGNDGSATTNVVGGTPGYTYTWSNGGTTASINSLLAGTYSVVINDANNCTLIDSVYINEPPCVNLTAGVASTNVSCNGGTNGTASAIVLFGTNPITYLWSTGATTSSVSGLAAGNYSVAVTDGMNCTTFVNFTITEPSPLSVALATTDIRCENTNDGTIELTVSGGTFPYTYVWSNGLSVEDQINLSDGSYSVTITDANGCTTTASATVVRPSAIVVSSSITPVTCNGGTDGAVDATVSGGVGPYTYSWSSGATTQDINGLTSDEYLLTVTDANNCSTSPISSLVDQPDTIKISNVVSACPVPGSGLSQVTLTATGGNAGQYQFSVDGGSTFLGSGVYSTLLPVNTTYTIVARDTFGCLSATNAVLTVAPEVNILTVSYPNCVADGLTSVPVVFTVTGGSGSLVSFSTDSGATWMAAGVYNTSLATGATYDIIAQDSLGCNSVTETISISTDIQLSGVTSSYIGGYNISCQDSATGSINLSASGGAGSYSYAWSDASTTEDISNLTAGSYSVVVTDNSGCADTIAFNLTEPTALSGTIVSVNNFNGYQISCAGGSNGAIDLNISGGVAGYSYLWTNSATTQDISSLNAGSYSVAVTDTNGCRFNANISLTEPLPLLAPSTQQNVLCNAAATGSIDLTTSGGVAPYTYAWNTAAITEDISSLTAGSYSVTLTDANGCTFSNSFTITEPTAVVVSNTLTNFNGYNISCNGTATGGVDLNTIGGVSPYTYLWSNAATTEDISSVIAGSYSVTITDNNGCSQSQSFVLTEPAALANTIASVNDFNGYEISCNGNTDGAIDFGVSGGVTAYTYSWSNSASTEDISNLAAGTYSVLVTDANGCTITSSLTLSEPSALTLSATTQNILCNAQATGSIDLTSGGGVPAYSYSWSNSATTEDITSLTAGTYSVLLTDLNGCSISSTFTITEPTAVVVTNTLTDYNGYNISCNGTATGGVDLTTIGGVSPYTYAWSNSATTEDITSVIAGSYNVTITDNNGCSQTQSFVLTEPTVLSGSVLSPNDFNGYEISCAGGTNGAADLTVGGGVPSYTYAWSNSTTTEDLANIGAGTYSVTVTDLNGCQFTAGITLSEPAVLAMTSAQQNVLCNGLATGIIDLTVSGGVTAYTYAWSNAATTEDLSSLSAGSYSVIVTDLNGCAITGTYVITEPTALSVTNTLSDYNGYNISCYGLADGLIDLTVSGGVSGYTYLWSNASGNEDLSNVTAGNYSVIVTDANGCTYSQSFTLTEPAEVTGTIASVNDYNGYDVRCYGETNGAIDLSITGGVPAYTFSWSTGASTEDITAIGSGIYSVVVTDQNGCSYTTSIGLSSPTILSLSSAVQNVPCNGYMTGSIDVTTAGGVLPYSYTWSNGELTEDLDSLGAGTYTVFMTDNNGCMITGTYVITELAPVAASHTTTMPLCAGDVNGTIDLTTLGGTSPYDFAWSTGSTTEDLSNIAAGMYIVTVTDANNCFFTDTIYIAEPLALTSTLTSPFVIPGYNVSGYGANDGSTDLSVSGGTAPYTYGWNNGSTAQDLSGIGSGTYVVTVTDANGCATSDTITLLEPYELAMPTGFSPNGDGFNDYFVVHGLEVFPDNRIEIFNRWGNQVYVSDNYANMWNGTNESGEILPDGTYFVILSINQDAIVLKGYVDIRR